ncbi:glycosyltransferase family 2 protein [Cupriavidus sp. AU9028]|nr:glycosyltransferase family 2 protein [Cupriavidus sp. AU9028]
MQILSGTAAASAGERDAITVSIVSHGQMALMTPLLAQLQRLSARIPLHLVVTLNLPEAVPAIEQTPRFRLTWLRNDRPLGFGANHNRAFAHCRTACFCVLNPDVRLEAGSLAILADVVARRPGVAGPRVVSPRGTVEDSARHVPSVWRLLRRWASGRFEAEYPTDQSEQQVDWIAGMCMVFDSASFARVGGFDETFWLYCEDVDLCLRMHLAGLRVTWVQDAVVVHDAQRASRRRWRYLAWHVESLIRLLCSPTYWRFRMKTRQACQ